MWPQQNPYKSDQSVDPIPDPSKLSNSSVPVSADIIADGGTLEEDGVLENVQALGIHEDFPQGSSEQDVRNLKYLAQEVPRGISKINASIIAPNAICKGRITNATAAGMSFTISQRKPETNSHQRDTHLKNTEDRQKSDPMMALKSEQFLK